MSEDKKDYSVTNLNTVVAYKSDLLSKLRENRDRHDAIYQAAVSGYWIKAAQVLEEKKTEFNKATAKLNDSFDLQFKQKQQSLENKDYKDLSYSMSLGLIYNANWTLVYPENHTEDYDRVIAMLEMSVAEKVELSIQDFDCYARNNWGWRKQFASTNTAYIDTLLSGNMAVSGCLLAATGSYIADYAFKRASF